MNTLQPPTDAKAIILAEFHVDQCESQTDYYGSTTTRRVFLAWSRHTRDLFAEMRKAAAGWAETAHLGPTAPATVEHREKYSMGSGFFLQTGRYSGWRVRKLPLTWASALDLEVPGVAAPLPHTFFGAADYARRGPDAN